MFLRAWHQWLKIAKSNRPHRRRLLNTNSAEHLESRCLLSATPSGTTTPVLTLSGSENVTIATNGANLTYQLGSAAAVPFGSTPLSSLSMLTINGSSSNNPITITLPAGNGLSSSFLVVVNGGGGDDVINAAGCAFSVSLVGGSGRDSLTGGSANDTLFGGSGDDTIRGGAGDDLVNGMGNNDFLFGDAGNDELYGGAGRDFLDGGADDDLVKGQGGQDTITGSRANAEDELVRFRLSPGRPFLPSGRSNANIESVSVTRNEYQS